MGAVRVSSVSLSGKQVTLTYVEPGTWFGDIALFDGLPRTHDADAHGRDHAAHRAQGDFARCWRSTWSCTTLLLPELPPPARDVRLVEDLNTGPLRARLAKQVMLLVRSWRARRREIRIGLQLAQEDTGAAARRVAPARQPGAQGARARGAMRIEPTRRWCVAKRQAAAIAER